MLQSVIGTGLAISSSRPVSQGCDQVIRVDHYNINGHAAGILHLTLKVANEPPHDKTSKMTVRPVKTQISLGIRLV